MQWVLCVVGILLVGVGVSFEVTANVVTLAGEGMVLALCKAFPLKFANTKVGFDVTLVLIASTLSLVFLGQLEGVREGTVAAAICVGLVAKQVNRPMTAFAKRYLVKKRSRHRDQVLCIWTAFSWVMEYGTIRKIIYES